MEEQRLSFALMLSYLDRVLARVEDPRQPSNAPIALIRAARSATTTR
jgi:hypothetical protein